MNRSAARFILALVAVLLGTGVVVAMFFFTIPQGNERTFDIAAGLVLGWGSGAIAFYFGTSESSSQKNEMINRLTDKEKEQ